jgi:hypothetical protein
VGRLARDGFSEWARDNFPSIRGGLTVRLEDPSLTVTTLYGNVMTGNAMGQQRSQRLPVGVEAVAAARVEVTTEGSGMAARDAVLRVARTVPTVLAAHQQNVLEYALADEGLVPMLVADAVAAKLSKDPLWEPDSDALDALVERAIGVVQKCLFHVDTLAPWLWSDGPRVVHGPDLLMLDGNGTVGVEAPTDETISLTDPRTGTSLDLRFVPSLDWSGSPAVAMNRSSLLSAEAAGPSGAVVARLDLAGSFRHDVAIWSGERLLGTVARDVVFRDHLIAWTEDPGLDSRDVDHMLLAQVEDWDDLRETMAVVSPPSRDIVVGIDSTLGLSNEIALDGVPLGLFGPGRSTIGNVPAGPHELWARPVGTGTYRGSQSMRIDVPAEGPAFEVMVDPTAGFDSEAGFAFWFALMSTFHAEDAGPLPHLERIAAMAGYPPLPETLRVDPRDDLEALAFWVEGLDRHLEFVGGRWADKDAYDPLASLRLAEDVVSITELTLKMLLDLPEEIAKVGRVTVLLASVNGRAEFSVGCQTPGGVTELIKGTADGVGCTLQVNTLRGTIVHLGGNVMSALAIVGGTLSLGFDVVELVEALQDGDVTSIAWASFDVGVDLATMVLHLVKFMDDLGLMALATVTKSIISFVGAAIAVVATFLDAYRDADGDFWGAWSLLLHPGGFADALRSAGFFSSVASLVTTAIVTASLPMLTGVTMATAFTTAVLAATGVGLIVFAAILAVWTVLNWDQVRGWFSGAVKQEDVEDMRSELEDVLNSTMHLQARMNSLNVTEEVAGARSERGIGLSLMHLRSECGDERLVRALGRADLYHLDGGSAQGRRARATREVSHWVDVLWREVDDLIDDDRPNGNGEASEGFHDYKGTYGSKDLDFDADIQVSIDGGERITLVQAGGGIGSFLGSLDPVTVEDVRVSLSIEGDVHKGALEDWSKALGAIFVQLSKASQALSRASRESAFVASSGAEVSYTRARGLVEVRLPDALGTAQVEVGCQYGGVVRGGEVEAGPVVIQVFNGTAMLTVTGWHVTSRVVDHPDNVSKDDFKPTAKCTAYHWGSLAFGSSVLDHGKDE